MKNVETKIQVLKENHKASGENITLREYTEREAENNPQFFHWLFDEDFDQCGWFFVNNQRNEYNAFLTQLDKQETEGCEVV